jgi:hypothetical protein
MGDYLSGTTRCGPTLGGRPTAVRQTQVLTGDACFGVRSIQFGLTVAWVLAPREFSQPSAKPSLDPPHPSGRINLARH